MNSSIIHAESNKPQRLSYRSGFSLEAMLEPLEVKIHDIKFGKRDSKRFARGVKRLEERVGKI
jgi:hypothetical protein